jgi:2-hydroxy-6-oxonona-2,4-dienedioate hydrolase
MTSRHESPTNRRSRLWYLLPIFLSIVGGVIAYFVLRGNDPITARNTLWVGVVLATAATVAFLAIYASYNSEVGAARERVLAGSKVIETARGPIEYTTYGQGPPVLVIHGAGGGYDQGLVTAKELVGEGYQSVIPSRSGYLRTPIPTNGDATSAAQADNHAALLDALGINNRVVVVGVSAGGLSSVEFSLRYPDRTAGLVLLVPGLYNPTPEDRTAAQDAFSNPVAELIMKNDFAFWLFAKLLGSSLDEPMFGTPSALLDGLSQSEQQAVQELKNTVYPISMRYEGIKNDNKNDLAASRYPYESINVPTLLISAKDDLFKSYLKAEYAAKYIPNAKFVPYESGGHLLLRHDSEVRDQVQQHISEALTLVH